MKETEIPEVRCLHCGRASDRTTAVTGPSEQPRKDDFTMCVYCGEIMAFTEDCGFRPLTPSEHAELLRDHRDYALLAAEVRKVWQTKN